MHNDSLKDYQEIDIENSRGKNLSQDSAKRPQYTRPNISQCRCLKSRRSTNFVKFFNAGKRILRVRNCEMFGRVVLQNPLTHVSKLHKISDRRILRLRNCERFRQGESREIDISNPTSSFGLLLKNTHCVLKILMNKSRCFSSFQ